MVRYLNRPFLNRCEYFSFESSDKFIGQNNPFIPKILPQIFGWKYLENEEALSPFVIFQEI